MGLHGMRQAAIQASPQPRIESRAYMLWRAYAARLKAVRWACMAGAMERRQQAAAAVQATEAPLFALFKAFGGLIVRVADLATNRLRRQHGTIGIEHGNHHHCSLAPLGKHRSM